MFVDENTPHSLGYNALFMQDVIVCVCVHNA